MPPQIEFAQLETGEVAQLRILYKRRLGRRALDRLVDGVAPLLRDMLAQQLTTPGQTRRADISEWTAEISLKRFSGDGPVLAGELLQTDADVSIVEEAPPPGAPDDEEIAPKKTLETRYLNRQVVALFNVYLTDRP